MKKIPIKFRGRCVDNGEYIYGVYVKSVPMSSFPGIVDDDDYIHDVDPDSVAQLVGYDVDGKEVYEGDTLTDILGNEYTARIRIELICEDRRSTLRGKVYTGTVDNLKLKGEAA